MVTPSKAQLATVLFGTSAAAIAYVLFHRRRRALRATVTQLVIFPVKSCRGIELEKVELDVGGIVHDREWMIVRAPQLGSNDATVDMLTIRDYPRMATIQPSFTSQGKLMLATDEGKSIVVDSDACGVKYKSIVWRSEVSGIDQGDAISSFLSAFLECPDKPVRLIRIEALRRLDADSRYCGAPEIALSEDKGGYARLSDYSQLSLISNQTLAWLNKQEAIGGGVTNLRFRMNIVVDADKEFSEDTWQVFSVGEVGCRYIKRCGRCSVPTVDPAVGTKDMKLEPLKTLKKLRHGEYPFLPSGTCPQAFFGVQIRHIFKPGQCIRVGDRVSVTVRSSW